MLKNAMIFALCLSFASSAIAEQYITGMLRGRQIDRFKFGEQCVHPIHFKGGVYTPADESVEDELCRYDFYLNLPPTPKDATPTLALKQVGVCPKIESTNPGLDIFLFGANREKDDFEKIECSKKDDFREGDKTAKFKQSLTCSYTPSILSYYHLSRMLGNIGNVPPAVIRTMDAREHLKYVEMAGQIVSKIYPNENPIIKQAWLQTWPNLHKDRLGTSNGGKSLRLFSDDGAFVYGALSQNIKKEFKYKELFGASYATRYADFKKKQAYKNLLDPRPVATWFSSRDERARLAEAAQTVTQMRDIADMIVMDYILSQADRIGNIHFFWSYISLDGSGLNGKTLSQKAHIITDAKGNDIVDPVEAQEMAAKQMPLVKTMLVRDNDCGVVKSNEARNNQLLAGLKHISPSTYKRIIWLASLLGTVEEVPLKGFFFAEALMTNEDWQKTRTYLSEVAAKLKADCLSGQLLPDLDLADVVWERPLKSIAERCSSSGSPFLNP